MEALYLHYFTDNSKFPFYIQYGYHDADLKMHTHGDFCELVIVFGGTAMHEVNEESYFIKKGDVFVLGDGVCHGYHETHQLQICNIMFQPEHILLPGDVRKLPGFHALFVIEPYLTGRKEFQSHLSLQLEDYEQIHHLTDLMLREYQATVPGKETLLTSYFMILATTLSRLYTLPAKQKKPSLLNIAKSVSYMESNFTEPLTLEEIAAISNLSPRHFSRLFASSYHTTPGNYILSLRMQHAGGLLKNTTLSIAQVAFQSGFNDSNYFSRQFRKFYNASPREYREGCIIPHE